MKNTFYFVLKASFILKIFKFILVMQEKWLDYKDEVNFKIYDVTTWLTSNYNTHIAQYIHILPKPSQVMKYITRGIYFFKNHAENEAGRLVPDLFLVFRKALCEVKARVLQLSFNIFLQPSTWHIIKRNYIELQNIDPEICSILFFKKRVWEQFLPHILCMIF